MIFADKLIKLRKQQGMSQGQLADRLGVTRQSVSKWESGASMPELSKMIAISEMYHVSMDYLVKDYLEEDRKIESNTKADAQNSRLEEKMESLERYMIGYSYTSKTQIGKIPLVSIRLSRHLGKGAVAKGIIAIGNVSVGILSIGCVSFGVVSIGAVAIGLFALGALAFGIAALGAVAFGVLAFGTVAIGIYAAGVAAVGKEIAVGVAAAGKLAIGEEASGTHVLQYYDGLKLEEIRQFILAEHPNLWKPLLKLLSWVGTVIR